MLKSLERSYTGREMEFDCLGSCELRPEAFEILRKIQKENGYVSFPQAVEWIIKHAKRTSEAGPTNPRAVWANDLHATLSEQLGGDYDELEYYSTIDTPLDRFHGVDAFFRWKNVIATIDLTQNTIKDEEHCYKADIIVSGDPQKNDDESLKEYDMRLKKYAERLGEVLKYKLEEKRRKHGRV